MLLGNFKVVSDSTAQKLKSNGFKLPDYLAEQQVFEKETGQIHYLGGFLEGKGIIFRPNYWEILRQMDGWAVEETGMEGQFKCFLVGHPEKCYQGENIQEACANALLSKFGKKSVATA